MTSQNFVLFCEILCILCFILFYFCVFCVSKKPSTEQLQKTTILNAPNNTFHSDSTGIVRKALRADDAVSGMHMLFLFRYL